MRTKLTTYLYRKWGEIAFFQAIILLLLRDILHEPPHKYTERKLFRCDCGELFWGDSPRDVQERHCGHHFRPAQGGTPWEFICLKMGWIR